MNSAAVADAALESLRSCRLAVLLPTSRRTCELRGRGGNGRRVVYLCILIAMEREHSLHMHLPSEVSVLCHQELCVCNHPPSQPELLPSPNGGISASSYALTTSGYISVTLCVFIYRSFPRVRHMAAFGPISQVRNTEASRR